MLGGHAPLKAVVEPLPPAWMRQLYEHRQGKHHSYVSEAPEVRPSQIKPTCPPPIRSPALLRPVTQVKLRSHKAPPAARFWLRVVEAHGLPATDAPRGSDQLGSADPFVDVHLDGSYWRTAVVKRNLNPVWVHLARVEPRD